MSVMATSNPDYYDQNNYVVLQRMRQATRFAVYGGSCMSYAQLASGRIDVCIDVLFQPYDYMALVPVIEGAGGILTTWEGTPAGLQSGNRYVAAGDRRIHEQTLKILSNQ